MNITNIDKAIAIMKRAGKVDMRDWQGEPSLSYARTEAELHACGTAACFAGWVAVSPEFQADGGYAAPAPRLGTYSGAPAIAKWLGVCTDTVRPIIQGDVVVDEGRFEFSRFYNKPWAEVTAQDVIDKLEAIKAGQET